MKANKILKNLRCIEESIATKTTTKNFMMLIFALFIFILLPLNINAATDRALKKTCLYDSDNLQLKLEIYNKKTYAEITLYKFGSNTWSNGKTCTGFICAVKITVDNWETNKTVNKINLPAYTNAPESVTSTMECPMYILVSADTLNYNVYASNDLSLLQSASDKDTHLATNTAKDTSDIDQVDKICTYTDSQKNLETVITIKSDGKMYSKNKKFFTTYWPGSSEVKDYKSFNYSGECPKYALTTSEYAYGGHNTYISNNVADLEALVTQKGLHYYYDPVSGGGTDWKSALIGSLDGIYESSFDLQEKDCEYEIPNCDNCKIQITFHNPNNLPEGQNVVKETKILSGDISKFEYGDKGFVVTKTSNRGLVLWGRPFSQDLPYTCPNLPLNYDEDTKTVGIYANDYEYRTNVPTANNGNPPTGDGPQVDIPVTEGCGLISPELRAWLKGLLTYIQIGAIAVTIILTMLDFAKGVGTGEAEEMKKIWKRLSRRIIILVLIFFVPLLIDFILGMISINGLNPNDPTCGL